MDELRDYRFYAEDMAHPSVSAQDYIFDTFVEKCFNEPAKDYLREAQTILQMKKHKLLDPESEESQKFILSRDKKIAKFHNKFPGTQI